MTHDSPKTLRGEGTKLDPAKVAAVDALYAPVKKVGAAK